MTRERLCFCLLLSKTKCQSIIHSIFIQKLMCFKYQQLDTVPGVTRIHETWFRAWRADRLTGEGARASHLKQNSWTPRALQGLAGHGSDEASRWNECRMLGNCAEAKGSQLPRRQPIFSVSTSDLFFLISHKCRLTGSEISQLEKFDKQLKN